MLKEMHTSNRAATYKVIINTLKGLPRTQKDAAFGLFGLFTLYAIRITCDRLGKRYPRRGKSLSSCGSTKLNVLRISTIILLHLRLEECLRHYLFDAGSLVIHPPSKEQIRKIPHQNSSDGASWTQARPSTCHRPEAPHCSQCKTTSGYHYPSPRAYSNCEVYVKHTLTPSQLTGYNLCSIWPT